MIPVNVVPTVSDFVQQRLNKMRELLCNPLLDSMKMYVSSQSVLAAIEADERRFEPKFSTQIARTKL